MEERSRRVSVRGRVRMEERPERCSVRTQPSTDGSKDGGRGPEPRKAGSLQELGKARKQIFL